jgi:hypothetical protein
LDTGHFAAHAIWLLCHPRVDSDNLHLAAEVLWESSRQKKESKECHWLDVPAENLELFREEVAAYLVLRDVLAGCSIQHQDTLLRGKLLLRTFDPEEVGDQTSSVLAKLKELSWWQDVKARSQGFLTAGRVEKFADLLTHDETGLADIVASPDTAVPILTFAVRQAIQQRLQKNAPWPNWVEKLVSHSLVIRAEREEILTQPEQQCASLIRAALGLESVEQSLTIQIPAFTSPEQLLDWYVGKKLHLLEFRVADAFARLEAVDDSALHEEGFNFVMKAPAGLRHRVRLFLDALDKQLAALIQADLQKFLYGPRSAIRILPDLLRTGRKGTKQRIWVLVMDGMRYDTWEAVVRPLLMEHFEVVDSLDRPYFSLLPSKTDIARRGLLAANLGKDWKNYFAKPTKDERVLAARAMGVSKQDFERKVFFVTDAETTEAREKLGYDKAEARDFNVLIYPISDDLGHHHNDTLASLNEKIRQQLRTQQGRRGIVDDLRRRIQPGDLVLVTSDHGFQELFPNDSVSVSRQEAFTSEASDEDVAYRYLRFKPKKALTGCEIVTMDWEDLAYDGKKQRATFTLAVGTAWFQREKGKPARFAHGGVSLAEMTIPGVLLRPIVEKAARVELLELPSEINVQEDQMAELTFEIVNSGNVETGFDLIAETNLGERLLVKQGVLPSGKHERVSCRFIGRYESDINRKPLDSKTTTAVFLTLTHGDLSGKVIRPGYGNQAVRVTVKPKPTKIDTDALKAFDEL